jgi:hypothetical protein
VSDADGVLLRLRAEFVSSDFLGFGARDKVAGA